LGPKGREKGRASLAIFNYIIDTAIILLLYFYPAALPLCISIYSVYISTPYNSTNFILKTISIIGY
jgi:hypothetical protein